MAMDNKYNQFRSSLFLLFLLGLSLYSKAGEVEVRCVERERQALLVFKEGLEDDHDILTSWTGGKDNMECCEWWGVKCSNTTGHVIVLDLRTDYDSYFNGRKLKGEVSSLSLSELPYLRYLDLSYNAVYGSQMGNIMGSLHRLKYLNLSHTWFDGVVPYQLGNITSLQALDLRETYHQTNNLDWLSQLQFLRQLHLSYLNLINVTNWVQVIFNLPFLKELHLHTCELFNAIPSSTPLLLYASLSILDLSGNFLNSSTFHYWLYNVSKNLVSLDMSYNYMTGLIPDTFGQMIYLQHINLAWNSFQGRIPNSFSNLSHLRSLDLSHNVNLSQPFPELLYILSNGAEKSLEILDLRENQFYDSLNGLTRFSSLKKLFLDRNKLEGTLTEIHFSGLSNLKVLGLSFNRLSLKMSSKWKPTFQLDIIRLANCSMIHFPKWLRTQHNFSQLDLSSASISDTLPNWFSNFSPRLKYLNISHNEISGILPELSQMFQGFPAMDFSSNNFSGPILSLPPNLRSLLLYKNRFEGSISFLCVNMSELHILDLSDNLFSGNLPNCWMNMKSLNLLNLGNNNFLGQIPTSFSFLKELVTLTLYGNSFIGKFPSIFRDFETLVFIDIGGNKLTGNISALIGGSGLTNLEILSIRSNKFSGSIHEDICHLSSLHVLDLSHNDITGKIPQYLSNLTALVVNNSLFGNWGYGYTFADFDGYDEGGSYSYGVYGSMSLQWKRQELEFEKLLSYQRIIDLSSNKLDGQIPQGITSLEGLISLNLSGNHLRGTIMEHIGKMKMLESLDLSRNLLSGEIPAGIASLNFLTVLDLSYNNLSGRIPSSTQLQTFDASSYFGNNGLCGVPLEMCPGDDFNPPHDVQNEDEDHETVTKELHISIAIGFVSGLCGVLVILLKGSWRNAYFVFMQNTYDWLYVRSCVYWARLMRMISG